MKHVISRENAQFKELKLLAHSTQARRRAERSLLDGIHLCQAYLRQVGLPLLYVVGESAVAHPEVAAIVAQCEAESGRGLLLPDLLFDQLAQVEQGVRVLFLIRPPVEVAAPVLQDSAVLLDNVQDPGNVGSILRSAAASGVKTVLCSAGTAFAWSSKVLRAGMGAHFSISIHENADLRAALSSARVPVYATSSHAKASLYDLDLSQPAVWIFGHEGQGVSPSLMAAVTTVAIPHTGVMESLNVAACAAVCMFEQMRQVHHRG